MLPQCCGPFQPLAAFQSKVNNEMFKPGPIAEQSNSLDHGRGDPSLNPGEGCYGEFEQYIRRILFRINVAEDHEPSIGIVCKPLIGSGCRALY